MYCMIETAFDNIEEAKQVISRLFGEKLVASCQIVESNSHVGYLFIRSFLLWLSK